MFRCFLFSQFCRKIYFNWFIIEKNWQFLKTDTCYQIKKKSENICKFSVKNHKVHIVAYHLKVVVARNLSLKMSLTFIKPFKTSSLVSSIVVVFVNGFVRCVYRKKISNNVRLYTVKRSLSSAQCICLSIIVWLQRLFVCATDSMLNVSKTVSTIRTVHIDSSLSHVHNSV